jgi:predicted transcriptional regulator
MTYKTGTIGEFMRWTKQVVRDPAAAKGVPKCWFDSEEAVLQSSASDVSAEAMVKLLSPENLAMLQVISRDKPESMRQLAELTGRKESNLSRTLKKLEKAGLVKLTPGPGRMRKPLLIASRVRLEIDLIGSASAVAVERSSSA